MTAQYQSEDGTQTSNFQKYQTNNPLMQRVIQRFMGHICEEIAAKEPSSIVDLGCGEGIVANELCGHLSGPFQYLGLDLNPGSIQSARELNRGREHMNFQAADIISQRPEDGWADVAICLEVLEHLPEPRQALANLMRWTRSWAIVSVPWEPWFRIGNLVRGRHLMRLGNHPEHIQQFRPRTLRTMLQEFSPRVKVGSCFPWLIGVMEKG